MTDEKAAAEGQNILVSSRLIVLAEIIKLEVLKEQDIEAQEQLVKGKEE